MDLASYFDKNNGCHGDLSIRISKYMDVVASKPVIFKEKNCVELMTPTYHEMLQQYV
jgi:hypothetical protein